MIEKRFFDNLERFSQTLKKEHPEIFEIASKVWAGAEDSREGLRRILALSANNKDLHSRLEQDLLEAFGHGPGSSLEHLPDRQQLLNRWGFSEEDLLFQPDPERDEYMLHPLLQGMIAELLQFDGDIPELRSGPLPEGGAPAVPVKTTSRNPLLIGALLKKASEEVSHQLAIAQKEQDKNTNRLIEVAGGLNSTEISQRVRTELQKGAGIEGYRPGQKAEMREVEAPNLMTLTNLPESEKRKLVYEALSTTQGRRSITPVVLAELQASLTLLGFNKICTTGQGKEMVSQVEWSMLIDGGPPVSNPNFNYIETATRSLVRKIQIDLEGKASRYTTIYLSVSPINAIDERRVGWTATVSV